MSMNWALPRLDCMISFTSVTPRFVTGNDVKLCTGRAFVSCHAVVNAPVGEVRVCTVKSCSEALALSPQVAAGSIWKLLYVDLLRQVHYRLACAYVAAPAGALREVEALLGAAAEAAVVRRAGGAIVAPPSPMPNPVAS